MASLLITARQRLTGCDISSAFRGGLRIPRRDRVAAEAPFPRLSVCCGLKGIDRLPQSAPLAEVVYDDAKVNLPPRICTLREFGKSGEGMVAMEPDSTTSGFLTSLAANVELSSKVQDWEILSGRLAMMVFASAVLVEALTGNSMFHKLDSQRLLQFCAAAAASSLVAAGFAVALQAKTRVAYTMSKKYESIINAMVDNVIDGLLFDKEE